MSTPKKLLPGELDKDVLAVTFNTADIGFWRWDLSKDEIFWSDTVYSIFGISKTGPFDFDTYLKQVPAGERRDLQRSIDEYLNNPDGVFHIKHRIVRPDGATRWVEGFAKLKDPDNPAGLLEGTVRDITFATVAEEELASDDATIRSLVDADYDAIGCYKLDDRLTIDMPRRRQAALLKKARLAEFNNAFSKLLGSSYAELYGSTLQKLSTFYSKLDKDFLKILAENNFEKDFISPKTNDNSPADFSGIRFKPVFAQDTLKRIWVIADRVSSRPQALNSANENREILQYATNALDEGVFILSASGRFLHCNSRAAEILGATATHPEGRLYNELKLKWANKSKKVLSAGRHPAMIALQQGRECSKTLFSPGMPQQLFHYRATPVKDSAGELRFISCVLKQISANKQAAIERDDLSDLYNRSFYASPIASLIASYPDGIIQKVNTAFSKLSGYSEKEVIGKSTLDIKIWANPEDRARIIEVLEREGHIKGEPAMINSRHEGPMLCELDVERVRFKGRDYSISAIRNISDRYIAQRRLREQRDFNEAILNTANVLIIALDSGGRIVRFNRYCESISGQRFKEIRGKKFWDVLIPAEERDGIQKAFGRLIERKGTINSANDWIDSRGRRHTIAWASTCIMDDEKEVRYVVSVGLDMTEQKRNERVQKLISVLVEKLNSAASLVELAKIQSEHCTNIFGFDAFSLETFDEHRVERHPVLTMDTFDASEGPVLVANIIEKKVPKSLQKIAAGKPRLINRRTEVTTSQDLNTFGSGKRSMSLMFVPIRHQNDCLGILSIQSYTKNRYSKNDLELLQLIADHSSTAMRRILAQENLQKQSVILKQTGALAQVGGWEINLKTGEVFWTRQTYAIHDLIANFRIDLSKLLPMYKAYAKQDMKARALELLGKGKAFEEVVPIQSKTGQKKWVRVTGEFEKRSGQIVRAFGAIQDITRQKENEDELKDYREHLEKLVAKRSAELEKTHKALVAAEKMATLGQLTSVVSHELRNPLGTIRSSLYTIGERYRSGNKNIERPLKRAERNVMRCDLIIEELLEYSRVGKLNLEEINISEWLNLLLDEFAFPEDVQLVRKIDRSIVATVDKEKLRRCVVNLIDNGCQAMQNSPKRLKVSLHVSKESLYIDVLDNGKGLKNADKDKLFEPLYSTKSFGVGLGLPIVKQIVNQHRGTISLKDQPKGGVKAQITIPVERPANKTG